MAQTSMICPLLVLASLCITHGAGVPYFFPPQDANYDRDQASPTDIPDFPPPGRDKWSRFQHHDDHLKSAEDMHSVKPASFSSKLPATMELLYNLELVKCPSAKIPSSGQMRSYETWVHDNNQGAIRCWSKEVSSGNIPKDKGAYGNIYTIRSEHYGTPPYYPRRLQYFNLKCPSEGMITSMTTDLEGQASLTISNKTLDFCVDYVQVMYEDSGSSCELCGDQTVITKNCEREFEGGILVTFRTSHLESHFTGFEMDVICYDASEQNLPGCIQTLPVEKEKTSTSKEDAFSYYSATKNFLPSNAEAQLMNFYKNSINTADTFSAESNYDMLRLALLSQSSCNAVLRAVGRGVSQMFPNYMVMQAKMNGWEYA